MSFKRLFNSNLSEPAKNSDFTNNFGDPAKIDLPGISDLSSLGEEAKAIVTYVRLKMGEPILTAHIDNSQIFLLFEEANLKYSSIINTYQARSWMINYYGLGKDFCLNDLTGKLPQSEFHMLKRMTDNISGEIAHPVGGTNESRKGYITLIPGVQDYDIYNDIIDSESSSSVLDVVNSLSSTTNSTKIELKNIHHYSPITLYRFYDPYSSINLLSQEFNFESFNTETIFYVLPIWTDILRAQQLNMSDKVRRSNFSYERVGRRLRIFPAPKISMKLFIDWETNNSAFNDSSSAGISNFSQIPFTDIAYDKINAPGKMWIRSYTYALSMETEGRIRRKYHEIPIPGSSITMDGAELVQEARQEQVELETKLREDLEKLTIVNVMKDQADLMDANISQYKQFPNYIYMMSLLLSLISLSNIF